eukprot:3350857-Amphidinium_carterae.1
MPQRKHCVYLTVLPHTKQVLFYLMQNAMVNFQNLEPCGIIRLAQSLLYTGCTHHEHKHVVFDTKQGHLCNPDGIVI